MSFKIVKRKLKEYSKKTKGDIGLEFLEFTGDPDSDNNEQEASIPDPIPDPMLIEEYQLPTLLQPSSYAECIFQLD